MKCRKCGAKAVVNMRQHKLALCQAHFLEWVPEQSERFIKKNHMFTRDERILVAVSGGKDSLSLWDILLRLGYQVDGLYIDLGIDDATHYSEQSRQFVEKFSATNGRLLHIVNIVQEYGVSIPELSKLTRRGRGKPCSICGLVKRHVMNRIARQLQYDVLATGHNLDDEAAVLFGNTLSWSGEYLLRQGPVLPAQSGLARKVKPLFRFYEREMTAYALLRGIEYIYAECPYAIGSKSLFYKELLNRLEHERPGAKLSFYIAFLEARENGLFSPREEHMEELHICPSCAQPTSAPELCSFCRMLERVGKP